MLPKTACSAVLAALILQSTPLAQCSYDELVPSVAQPIQWFGASIGMSDGHLLVGAPQETVGLQRRGAVYAFELDVATGLWRETQRLEPSFSVAHMRYGTLMDVQGGTAVISAPGTSSTPFGGGVFVFEYDTPTGMWVETQFLTTPGADFYGSMVRLMGDTLVITEAWGISFAEGRVHIFERDPSTGLFALQQVISSPVPYNNNRFASDAELIDGELLLLGDHQASIGGVTGVGVIRIFERDPLLGMWTETGLLESPTPIDDGSFGGGFVWDGSQLVVFQRKTVASSPVIGVAHVFERDASGTFQLVQTIERPGGNSGSNFFGVPLALSDGELLIHDYLTRWNAHRPNVRRFQRDSITRRWHYTDMFLDPVTGGLSGFALYGAIDDGRFAFGSPWSIISGPPQGRAFVFDADECGTLGDTYCTPGTPNSSGRSAEIAVRGSRFVANDSLVVSGTEMPPGALTVLLVGRAPGALSLPGATGLLCVANSVGRFSALARPASEAGTSRHSLDLTSFPSPGGPVAVQPGDTWCFQFWFRDSGPSSGFTDAVRLVMQ